MNDDAVIALLTEIRDLQRQQVEALNQTLANQAQMLATQQTVMKRQEEQIQRQTDQQAINYRARRWTRIAIWVAIALLFAWIMQPWLFLLSARSLVSPKLQ